jgi:predicted amino acid racemase
MSRDKQIEEMVMLMTEGARPSVEDAEALYNAGYRKASDVAREIIRILRDAGIDKYRYPVIAEIEKIYTEGK